MKVTLLAHTPEPEKLIALAGKLCYSKYSLTELNGKITDDDVEKFINRLMSYNHQSPLEHRSFTFGVEGVSRALLAQLTRHRLASFSVKSQRYVSEGNATFVFPETIDNSEEAKAIYLNTLDYINRAYDQLSKLGIEKEDARMVLPNATTTQLVVTMNARELLHFFNERCCNRAQWEIRELADEMLRQCKEVAPHVFAKAGAPCVKGPCPEGKMSCGNPRK